MGGRPTIPKQMIRLNTTPLVTPATVLLHTHAFTSFWSWTFPSRICHIHLTSHSQSKKQLYLYFHATTGFDFSFSFPPILSSRLFLLCITLDYILLRKVERAVHHIPSFHLVKVISPYSLEPNLVFLLLRCPSNQPTMCQGKHNSPVSPVFGG